jgi:Beta-lactamase class C and other penicillin binding proteins
MEKKKTLPRAASPEEAGISSSEILEFLKDVKEAGFELHGFMVIRDGVVGAEGFFPPFSKEYRHQMWSVSKSFVSAAIGFLIDEGHLALQTKIQDIFPEYLPKKKDENLEKLTVEHVLTMTSGKLTKYLSTKGENADWTKEYFDAPWYNEPGKEFKYVNENYYLLAAVVKKISGESVVKYLTPRLFEPLGIENPFWETDSRGVENGGWGLYLKTEDMAKYILCLQRRGKFEGKQVIPEEWAAAATTKRVDCKSFHASSNFGYGYGFWMNPVPDSFRANGLFSQFGISFDRYNAILICDSAIIKEEDFRQIIWRHFPAAFIEKNSQNTVENYNEKLASFVFERLPQKSLPIDGNEFGGKIMLKKNFLTNLAGFPTGALPSIMTAKMSEKTYPIAWAEFVREGENILFKWREGKDENAVALGADGEYKKGKIKLNGIEYITLSSAEKPIKHFARRYKIRRDDSPRDVYFQIFKARQGKNDADKQSPDRRDLQLFDRGRGVSL